MRLTHKIVFDRIKLILFFAFLSTTAIQAQTTDLEVQFIGTPPTRVAIGEAFAIQAQVIHVGASAPVVGETVTATLELIAPDGIVISTYVQSWNGFANPPGISSVLDNDSTNAQQVILQMPWTEASKINYGPDLTPFTNDDANWTVSVRVSSPSLETNLNNNTVTHSIFVDTPDLRVNDPQIRAKHPQTGQLTTNLFPDSRLEVSGTITNVGNAITQPGARFTVEARLFEGSITSNGFISRSLALDYERIILPASDGSTEPTVLVNGSVPYTITNLNLPADAEGNFTIQIIADVPDQDNLYPPPGNVVEELEEFDNNHQIITFTVDPGSPELQINPSSFEGDIGTFNGLDPIRIAFAISNVGTVAINPNDTFTVEVALSTNDTFSPDDFILREFDLSGDALGTNLLSNETINLDWIQQLPDNLEGDYYMVAHIPEVDIQVAFSSTPVITINSLDKGKTDLINSGSTQFSKERPSASHDGKNAAYEMEDQNNIKQIHILDPQIQITENGDAHSRRPIFSGDGNAVVFYSSATNLIEGDSDNNGHDDVFFYKVSSGQTVRAINFTTGEEGNGGSTYPDINWDGSQIVFESASTNLDGASNCKQIFLWDTTTNVFGEIIRLTNGNDDSFSASISNSGDRIVFTSLATNLTTGDPDSNGFSDIYLYDAGTAQIHRLNKNYLGLEAEGGLSDQATISGDGGTVVFRSLATNLITGKGISNLSVDVSGVGYYGNPTITVNDPFGNGEGAELAFMPDAIDLYGQIRPGGIEIISHGRNYSSPQVSIQPDPNFPAPVQTAVISAHLTHPLGEVYSVDVDAFLTGDFSTIKRISENADGIGGDMPSREPDISDDGNAIVYSTQSSNLLNNQIMRTDGKVFHNRPVRQARAQAILVGGIGEIEVLASGSGYSNGFLSINDLSGTGSGAIASYEVDSQGRISSIVMVNPGANYNLATTVVEVDNPRGGSGFVSGALRFAEGIGIGGARVGGGKVHRVEMMAHGMNYQTVASSALGLHSLIAIDGDGVDTDNDGKPDAKVNPDRIKIDSKGGIYIEQRFDISITSSSSLLATTLGIKDANKSIFINFAGSDSLPFVIGINNQTLTQIRDKIIDVISDQWNTPTTYFDGPIIENNANGGTSFTLRALSGKVMIDNSTSIQVTAHSNMLFGGSGFTRATPYITPPPTIHGFSEISSDTSVVSNTDGRQVYAAQTDFLTDDIYLYNSLTGTNERVSTSTFGFPANYLNDGSSTTPSNRFPSISGNGRQVLFSSDASGSGSLSFVNGTNQSPQTKSGRDIYIRDLKTNVLDQSMSDGNLSIQLLFPAPGSTHKFSQFSQIPIFSEVSLDKSKIRQVEYWINGEPQEQPAVNFDLNDLDRESIDYDDQHPNIYTYRFKPQTVYDELTRQTTRSGDWVNSFPADESGDFYVYAKAYPKDGSPPVVSQSARFVVTPASESKKPGVIIRSPQAKPVGEELYYTSRSREVLMANAWDVDGDLKYVQFFVNGANAVLQFTDQNLEGEIINLKTDNDYVFEFDDNGSVDSGHISVAVGQSLKETLINLGSAIENNTDIQSAKVYRDHTLLVTFPHSSNFYEFSSDSSEISSQNFNKIFRPTSKSPESFPFTSFWTPGFPGTFVINAIGVDTSNNFVSSQVSIVTSTTGSTPPTININSPNQIAQADAILVGGQLLRVVVNRAGSAYEDVPDISIAGDGTGAVAEAELDSNGQIKRINVINQGNGYSTAKVIISPRIKSLIDGSAPIVVANTRFRETRTSRDKTVQQRIGDTVVTVNVLDPDTGIPYQIITTTKRSVIVGFNRISDGSNMRMNSYGSIDATLPDVKILTELGELDLTGSLSSYSLIPNLSDSQSRPIGSLDQFEYGGDINATTAQVIFKNTGLNRGSITIEADAYASKDSTLNTVIFYVNGDKVGSDSQPPFLTEWKPDRSGFFSVWSQAIDDRGNKYCSDPLTIRTIPFGSPVTKITNPLGTSGDPIQVSIGSRIPLVLDARAKIGDINGSNQVAFQISNGDDPIDAIRQGSTSRFEASWVPNVPGKYKIYGQVTDSAFQRTLSEPTFVEVLENGKKAGGGGSLTPQVKMVYPQPRGSVGANLPVGQPINGTEYSRPLSNRTIVVPDDLSAEEYAYTSTSTVRLFARAGDYDGDLIGVQFYVNGTQGSIQFREVPRHGTQIKLSDGLSKSPDPLNPNVFILEFNNPAFDTSYLNVIGGSYDENQTNAILLFESYLEKLNSSAVSQNIPIFLPILPKKEDCSEVLFRMLKFLNIQKNLQVTPIEYRNFNDQLFTILLKYQDTRYAILESNPPNDEGFQNTHHARVFVQLLKEVLRGDTLSPWSHPYGHMWTPGLDGTYTIQARARDNSGNFGWSSTVSVTSTTGSTPPKTEITNPITISSAQAEVNQATGEIKQVIVSKEGSGHMRKPEVEAIEDIQPWFNIEGNVSSPKFLEEERNTGPGPGGEALESYNLDPNGTVTGVEITDPGHHFYNPTVKIRPILKSVTNGVPAILEADLYLYTFPYWYKTDNVQRIHVRNGGKGYAYPPKVRIIGDGFGAEAVANVDLDPASETFGEITSVDVTDLGMNYTETPIVEVYGGFGLDQVLIEANATSTGDNKLLHVEFYADGILLDRVKTTPYHTVWYPGQEGIHEVYSVTRDDKGNRYTSKPLQFSIQHVDGPQVELISPIGDLLSNSKFGKGGWPTFVAETDPGQAKVWKVEFQVDTMDRVNALWRGSSEDFLNNRWQYTWDPRGNDGEINTRDDNTYAGIPGKYKVRAIVTDHHQMIGLSDPEVFEIISIEGSQPPDNNMTFPVLFQRDEAPLYNGEDRPADDYATQAVDDIELVSLTTNSRYVFSTQAKDPDGALRGVQYEVDGANVHIQFLSNPEDGDTLELHNHDTYGTDHPPLLKCVFKKSLTSSLNQYEPKTSKHYHPQKPDEINQGNVSKNDLDNWVDSILQDGYFEVKIGVSLENQTDENGKDHNGTLHNFMELLNDISADTDDDFYTDIRELFLKTDPLDQKEFPASDNEDIKDLVNFNMNSKFLARSNNKNIVRLKVYDPRELFILSSNTNIIHAQAFAEVPHEASSSNDLQVFSHQYWEPKLEGEYTVQSIAVDTTGNATPSQKVSTLSVTKGAENRPEVSLSYFSDNLPLGSDINLRANVSDYTSSLTKGEIQFAGFLVNGRIFGALDNQSPFFTTLQLDQPGRYEIFAFAGDDEGNINFSRRRNIRVYTDSPYDLSSQVISSSKITISQNRRSTNISGLTLSASNQSDRIVLPTFGTRIRFMMGGEFESISEQTYTVQSIDEDGTLNIFEHLTTNDEQSMLSSTTVELLEVFKVGSQIFFPVSQIVNQGTLSSVQFYSNGESLEIDFVAPYSTIFTPENSGIYSLTAISTSYSGLQNILERKIYIEDKTPNTRMPYGNIEILPDLSGYSYTWNDLGFNVEEPIVVGRGSTLTARANFEDLDGTVEKVSIYLNGEIQQQTVPGVNAITFVPYSISDANIVEIAAVAEDNDGNVILDKRTILVYDPAPFPDLKLDPILGNEQSLLDGEAVTFNISSSGVLIANLQSASMQIQNQSQNQSLRNCLLVGNGQVIGYAVETGIGSGRFSFEWNVNAEFATSDGIIEIRALMPSSELTTNPAPVFFNTLQSAALLQIDPNILFNQAQGQGGINLPSLTFNGTNSVFTIVSSEAYTYSLLHKNPFASVEQATSQVIEDLLNRNPSQAEIEEAVNQINTTDLSKFDPIENQEFLNWVSTNLISRQGFQNIADTVGTYKTIVGLWPSSNEIDKALSVYVAFPNYGEDGSGDIDQDGYSDDQERSFFTDPNDPASFPQNGFKIGQYSDDTLSSNDFLARHKPVPPLFGNDRFIRYEENRRDFVNLLYKNKYDTEPTLQQTIQGAHRLAAFDPQSEEARRDQMLQQRQQLAMASMFGGGFGGQGNQGGNQQFTTQLLSGLLGGQQQNQVVLPTYANPEPAIIYISTFVLEEKLDNQDLIFGMPSAKNEFETVALMINLWKENIGTVSYDEVSNYSSMSSANRVSAIMKDARYRSRFPSVLRESTDVAENWKGSSWLGNFYYDENSYPWVYHSNFGWVYIESSSDSNAWLYLPKIGWVWFSENAFEKYPNGVTYYGYKQGSGWLLFDFYESDSEQDIYFDYSTGSWSNYSK